MVLWRYVWYLTVSNFNTETHSLTPTDMHTQRHTCLMLPYYNLSTEKLFSLFPALCVLCHVSFLHAIQMNLLFLIWGANKVDGMKSSSRT